LSMAMRKVGVFGAAGVLVAVLIIAAVSMSGLKLPGFYNKGTLIVRLTDAPVELEHLNVTITELWVHKAEHGVEEGEWISLTFVGTEPWYVDILSLRNVSRDLSVTELEPGNYTKIRMKISTANATYTSGATKDLIVPPEHIDVNVRFEIKAGQITEILIDMTAHISHTYRLSPVLKATVSGPYPPP